MSRSCSIVSNTFVFIKTLSPSLLRLSHLSQLYVMSHSFLSTVQFCFFMSLSTTIRQREFPAVFFTMSFLLRRYGASLSAAALASAPRLADSRSVWEPSLGAQYASRCVARRRLSVGAFSGHRRAPAHRWRPIAGPAAPDTTRHRQPAPGIAAAHRQTAGIA